MNKRFVIKSVFILSSILLTVSYLAVVAITVWANLQTMATLDPSLAGMVLLLSLTGDLWNLIMLLAGILALLSLKWPKLRSAGMVLGVLYGVRTAVTLFECFVYSNFDYILSPIVTLILIAAFVVSAIKSSE